MFILFGCASSTVPIKFYNFNMGYKNETNINSKDLKTNNKKSRVIVAPIQLPHFLNQEGLVMQIGENEIYTANYHRWAEPLSDAIRKLLVRELNNKSNHYYFEKSVGRWNQNARYNLRLEFDNFQASSSAKISVSGRYWLYGKNESLKLDNTFGLNETLNNDGYLHAIEQLEKAVKKLALDIVDSLDKLES
jgi:uncharacterized lipoprotein YmbA